LPKANLEEATLKNFLYIYICLDVLDICFRRFVIVIFLIYFRCFVIVIFLIFFVSFLLSFLF